MSPVPDWYKDFVAAVVSGLPGDIDEETAMKWIRDPAGLESALAELAGSNTISDALGHDRSSDGWTLVTDTVDPEELSAATMKMTRFLEEGEEDMYGDAVVERVQTFSGNLGQRHAEYLLAHPEEIPEEFRAYSLVFAGTIWESPDGNHQVPCITWRRSDWEFTFGILEGGLDHTDRLVQLSE